MVPFKAFVASDFTFKGPQGKHLRSTTKKSLATAQTVDACWRFQKNGDNGQKITYAKDTRIYVMFLQQRTFWEEQLA